jgi:hypothetical protein
MKTGKNPYEIRSDLLALAFNIVAFQQEMESNDTENGEEMSSQLVDKVVEVASKLNDFVSDNGNKGN